MTIADPPHGILPQAGLLIGGDRVGDSSGGSHQHIYPATGRATGDVVMAGAREMDQAVRAARAALPAWRAVSVDARRDTLLRLAALLRLNRERLGWLQTLENAVPHRLAAHFPDRAADYFVYYAGWADKIGGEVYPTWPAATLDYSIEEPYGVVAIIIPWNGPLKSLGATMGPALAAGNVVVVKPPELAPYTSLRLGELCLEAGFPPGVVNVVPAGPVGGDALVRHPGVDKIHFTGSGPTAKRILGAALENLTPVGLELGGKSANIVFDDADLAGAIEHALSAVVSLSGQVCISGTRVLAHSSVYDRLVELCASTLGRFKVGDPSADATDIGPVISAAACDRIVATIERATDERSGRLVVGGHRLAGELKDGYFVEPTVFCDVDNRSELARKEIFGPVLSIMRFEDEREAIELANDTPYGLAAYVHTNDLRRAHRVAAALEVGAVWVNGFRGIPMAAPFGGVKQSGYGRIGGRAGIREFTRAKNVWIAP